MSIVDKLKGVINRMLGRVEITEPFGVSADISSDMYTALYEWDKLFTKSFTRIPSVISSEAARLATIDMQITVTGGNRAKYIQNVLDTNRDRMRSKLELGCVYGGMILKPNGNGIDFIPATRYIPIEFDSNGNLIGVIFIDKLVVKNLCYNRLEYHHFAVDEAGVSCYIIENKLFKSNNVLTLGYEIPLNSISKWRNLESIVRVYNIDKPLFGYFRMPNANNIDVDSPLGVSIFSNAIESLKDFDLVYEKWRKEIKLSDKVMFVDEQAMMKAGTSGSSRAVVSNPIPELIKGLKFGNTANKCIEDYTPEIRVDAFKQTMQTQLDLISVQCGFSSGYFSFDARTGAITATQIQSEDQRTNSTCTDIQKNYKQAIDGLLYAMDIFYTLYNIVEEDKYEVSFYFKDLYVNPEEDRARAYQMVKDKLIPKWKYLVEYEGYTESEAKQTIAEAEGSTNQQDSEETSQDTNEDIEIDN